MSVRRLTVDDVAAYRALHRYGLQESPESFVETLENDAARPDATIADMLARGEGWGVFEGERLVGKLVLDALPYACLGHVRWLHAVYLHPDARGKGAARSLMMAAMTAACAEGVTRFALWVNARNGPARTLYGRLGFRETGRIPGGIVVAGAPVDDVLMTLDVASAPLDGSGIPS